MDKPDTALSTKGIDSIQRCGYQARPAAEKDRSAYVRVSLEILASRNDRMGVQEGRMNRSIMTTCIIRPGQPIPLDDEWLACSVEERVAAVWRLTKLCYAWRQEVAGEPRFIELLAAFNAHTVEYLMVGAHALAAHGHVRATKNLITEIDGVAFESAWPDRVDVRLGDTSIPTLSRHHLIANKRASGRLQDLADVERIEEIEGQSEGE